MTVSVGVASDTRENELRPVLPGDAPRPLAIALAADGETVKQANVTAGGVYPGDRRSSATISPDAGFHDVRAYKIDDALSRI